MFRRKRKARDFAEEIKAHLEFETERLREEGLDEREARAAARRAFGNVTEAEERFYESGRWLFWDELRQDLRFAFRMLRKAPGFAAVAVLTLAVAIGANALVFSALDAFLLRPLKVPQPESLYGLQFGEGRRGAQSYPNYEDFRDRNRSFDGLAAYAMARVGLDTGENPARAWLYEVSGNYFDVLNLHPHLGRFFHSSDEHGAGSAPYIVLSYAYWHGHFQDDPGVVGRRVEVNKRPFTIIGVAPQHFTGTFLLLSPDFFVPMVSFEDKKNLRNRGGRWIFETIGHLKAGVSAAEGARDLNSIGAYLEKSYPQDNGKMDVSLVRAGLYGNTFERPIREFVVALMLLAALILLAACANLGSLFAARAADRSREIAVRLALGSSCLRILRQLFTEALLISLMGGAIGLWGSILLLRALSAWNPFPEFPFNVPVSPDANVYGVALLLALASGFLFGAVPVRQVLRTDPYPVVKSGAIGRVGRRITARDVLLGVQIAICSVLVTSSLVAVRGLVRSLDTNFGFEPQNVMLAETDLNMAGYRAEAVPTMQKRMMDAMGAIPGVTTVALINCPPLVSCWHMSDVYRDETADLRPSNVAASPITYQASPEFFDAAGTRLLVGRGLSWHDDKNSPLVGIVNG